MAQPGGIMPVNAARRMVGCLIALAAVATSAGAQTSAPATPPAAPAPAQPVSVVVAKPTYTSIVLEIDVNKSAADVWKRVGKYCDIAEWFRLACTITSGKDGEVGAV